MCEFYFRPFVEGYVPNTVFTIQVPHIVADIGRARDRLKVRHMSNLESSYVSEENALPRVLQYPILYYNVDNKYVNIFTSTFSKFLISTEAINCCSDRTRVMIFWKPASDGINVQLYFCSLLYIGTDYRKVIFVPCGLIFTDIILQKHRRIPHLPPVSQNFFIFMHFS